MSWIRNLLALLRRKKVRNKETNTAILQPRRRSAAWKAKESGRRLSSQASRSAGAPIYRYKKQLPLSELNNDVFKKVASLIPPEFLTQCHSASYGTYAKLAEEKKRHKGVINMEQVLHNLSNEDWRVERLVAELIRVDNRLALQELLYFWPAHFVTTPPPEVLVAPGDQLCIDIDVRGFPMPQVEWFFPNCSSAGVGRSLVHDYEGLPFGTYYVKVSNSRSAGRKGPRYHREERLAFEVKSSELNAAAAFADDEVGGPTDVTAVLPASGTRRRAEDLGSSLASQSQLDNVVAKSARSQGPSRSTCKATRKVALLVGMCSYKHQRRLRAAYNDLPELAAALTKLGYRVFTLFDLPFNDLIFALELYARLLDDGAYGFLYLGGHGQRCPTDQIDYLIPVDVDGTSRRNLVSRNDVVAMLQEKRPALNVVVWDTCRSVSDMDNRLFSGQKLCDEANLIVFMPCVASQTAYEVSYNNKTRSGLVHFLLSELIEKEKERPSALKFFTELGTRMCQQDFCTEDDEGVKISVPVNPVMNLGAFRNNSLWDPVDEDSQPSQQTNAVLDLWNEDCRLTDGIYPEPEFHFGPDLSMDQVNFKFLAHNFLKLQFRSSSPCAFDMPQLQEDFRRLGLKPDFVYAEVPLEQTGLHRRVTLHHLQLWQLPDGFGIALPVVNTNTGHRSCLTLKCLFVQRMFAAVKAEMESGRRR